MSVTTGVVPARMRYYSDAMHVEVVTTYGYRPRCRCEWRGRVHKRYTDAVAELQEHKHAEHGSTD